MSCVVDLSRISECYRNKVRCVRVRSLNELNIMLEHRWVISVYHHDIGNIVVYYIDDTDGDSMKYDTQICS